MRYTVWVARFLLGFPFLVVGLNTFLWAAFDKAFIQPPKEMPHAAAAMMQAFSDTHFMHQVRGLAEFAGGAMVLSGMMTPLGLAVLAPVIVHVVLYHHYIDSTGLGFAYFLLALELFLAYAYWPAFQGMFVKPIHRWRK